MDFWKIVSILEFYNILGSIGARALKFEMSTECEYKYYQRCVIRGFWKTISILSFRISWDLQVLQSRVLILATSIIVSRNIMYAYVYYMREKLLHCTNERKRKTLQSSNFNFCVTMYGDIYDIHFITK